MSETRKFYRAVSQAELEDWRESGLLRAGGNSLEGKYLTDSLEHALDWWRLFEARVWYGTEDGGAVLQVEVPSDVADEFDDMGDMHDGIGPAWYAQESSLEQATVTVVKEWS